MLSSCPVHRNPGSASCHPQAGIKEVLTIETPKHFLDPFRPHHQIRFPHPSCHPLQIGLHRLYNWVSVRPFRPQGIRSILTFFFAVMGASCSSRTRCGSVCRKPSSMAVTCGLGQGIQGQAAYIQKRSCLCSRVARSSPLARPFSGVELIQPTLGMSRIWCRLFLSHEPPKNFTPRAPIKSFNFTQP